MNKKTSNKDAAYDAFPMNKKTGDTDSSSDAFRAFGKIKALPEVDAFSKKSSHDFDSKKSTQDGDRRTSSDYDAFSKNKKEDDASSEFPMSKRSDRSRENRPPRENRNPHLVFEPMTYSAATIPSTPTSSFPKIAPAIMVVSGGQGQRQGQTDSAQEDASFAAKFASKMKITTDPNYVPPPTIVNMESEQDFPTLGGPVTAKAIGWGQSTLILHTEEKQMETQSPRQKRRKQGKQGKQGNGLPSQVEGHKKSSVLPRRALGTRAVGEETEDFKPIDYDEDAFDEEGELLSSDLDEEALFGDSNDEDEDEGELDPNIYENRRHPDETN